MELVDKDPIEQDNFQAESRIYRNSEIQIIKSLQFEILNKDREIEELNLQNIKLSRDIRTLQDHMIVDITDNSILHFCKSEDDFPCKIQIREQDLVISKLKEENEININELSRLNREIESLKLKLDILDQENISLKHKIEESSLENQRNKDNYENADKEFQDNMTQKNASLESYVKRISELEQNLINLNSFSDLPLRITNQYTNNFLFDKNPENGLIFLRYLESEKFKNENQGKRIDFLLQEISLIKDENELLRRENHFLNLSKFELEKEMSKIKNESNFIKENTEIMSIRNSVLNQEKEFYKEFNKNQTSIESDQSISQAILKINSIFTGFEHNGYMSLLDLKVKSSNEVIRLKLDLENMRLLAAKNGNREILHNLSCVESQLKEAVLVNDSLRTELVEEKRKRYELEFRNNEMTNNQDLALQVEKLTEKLEIAQSKLEEYKQKRNYHQDPTTLRIEKLPSPVLALDNLNYKQQAESYKNEIERLKSILESKEFENKDLISSKLQETLSLKTLLGLLHKNNRHN